MSCDDMISSCQVFRLTFSSDRKEVYGVRGIAGCRSTREANVTEGQKMPPEVDVVVEVEVEEEEVVTVEMLLGKANTIR